MNPTLYSLDLADEQEARPSDVVLRIEVHGAPVGKGSVRVVPRKDGKGVARFFDDRTVSWGERCRQVAALAHGGTPIDEPVTLEVTAWVSRPKRMRRKGDTRLVCWAKGRPDLDNVVKLIGDSLTRAGVWTDDACVAELDCKRLYLPMTHDARDIGVERVEIGVVRCPVEVPRG